MVLEGQGREPGPVIWRAAVAQDQRVMRDANDAGVRLKQAHLMRELARIRPEVVAVEKCNELAAAGLECAHLVHAPRDAVGMAVQKVEADDVRMARRVGFDDFPRAVGRTVIADDDLDIETDLLRERTFDRLRNPGALIVGHDQDADLGTYRHAYPRFLK